MIQYNKQEIFTHFITNVGLTPRLASSIQEKIPDNIMPSLPKNTLVNMYEPRIYPTGIGYGLIGTSRIGKSCANAVVVKRGMRGLIHACVEHISDSNTPLDESERCMVTLDKCTSYEAHRIVNWVYWPECYNWFQKNTITDFGSNRLPRFHTESLKKTKLLILDDLGRDAQTVPCGSRVQGPRRESRKLSRDHRREPEGDQQGIEERDETQIRNRTGDRPSESSGRRQLHFTSSDNYHPPHDKLVPKGVAEAKAVGRSGGHPLGHRRIC